MRKSFILSKTRHYAFSCSLGRLFSFAIILIVLEVTIVAYQIFVWSPMRCANPITCSKVLFFNNLINSNESLINLQKNEYQIVNESKIKLQNPAKDSFLDCGINGRKMSVNGKVNLHVWYGWCGFTTDDLRRDPSFPMNPKLRKTLTKLKVERREYKYFSGKRMFGYIHPPKTGLYQFFISSEDSSDLWLSLNDEPRNTRMIAYIGEARNQYGGSVRQGDYNSKNSQQSANISLIKGEAYFFDMYQKKKSYYDHMQVAWRIPGTNEVNVIGPKYISQYIDEDLPSHINSKRRQCITKHVPGLFLRYTKHIQVQDPDFVENLEFFIKVPRIADQELDNVLPSCPYTPKYLSRPIKKQFDAQLIIIPSYVHPNDSSAVHKDDISDAISEGNGIIPEKEAKHLVDSYMIALSVQKGDKYKLNRVVHIEAKYDIDGSVRYFIELDVKEANSSKSFRLSRYLYSPSRTNIKTLCYPQGYIWKSQTPIYMIVTVMNYGYWIKDLILQLDKLYRKGIDRDIFLTVIDFNSTDINLDKIFEYSSLRRRYTVVKQSQPFWKTHGLNIGAALVKNPNSIIFTMDLHLKLPANIFDAVRKHTIEGKTVFTPKLMKLKCGFSPSYSQGGWDTFGYGLFAAYKSDWDKFGGMDENQFRHKWGGEDVDLMDRVLKQKLEVERICLPKLYHFFHPRDQDWYENARI